MKPRTLRKNGQKLFLFWLLFIISFKVAFTQDIHFSLFNAGAMFVSPANTGNFEGNWRISGNYRDQWRTLTNPFTTAYVSFDKHFILRNQNVSAGAYFLTDQSGGIGLTSNKLYISAALNKAVNKNNFIVGLQTGYVFRSFGNDGLTLPSDYDHDQGDFLGSNNGEKRSYLDINFGAIWKSSISIFEPEAGIALSHINSPNESFYNEKEKLPIRYTFHGKVRTKLSDEFYFQPAILIMNQRQAKEMMLGTNIGLKILKRRSNVREIFTGIYLRDGYFTNSDAFTIIGGASVGRMDITLGYDFNISGLKVATSNKGAFEISFVFKSISTFLNTYSIPCERL